VPARAFSLDEIRSFAALAGDHNPLHVDPIAARRTLLGAPVVHGMLLALWALEELAVREPRPRALVRLETTFSKAVAAGETIDLVASPSGEGSVTATLRRSGALRASIGVEWDASPSTGEATLPLAAFRDEPRALSFDEAAAASGEVPLALDRALLDASFPHLSRVVPADQIAVVLATSRIVGMECPGLHSIYAKLDVRFERRADASGGAAPALAYRVERANKRFSKLELSIAAPRVRGTIEAFFRPPPVRQLDMAEAARLVAPSEFEGRRALVIGGSRGLGEVTAKLVAAGGGDVRITYQTGRDDAERVVSEIQAAGGRAACFPYDVLAPERGLDLGSFRPSHLYYFATKVISFGDRQAFSPALFRAYCAYYVDGFAAAVELAAKAAGGLLEVLYPSSVFVDRTEPGAAEYAAAKAAGEIVGAHLAARIDGLRIASPRLVKVRTDQTASLGPLAAERPEKVMLSVLRGA
jgi:hypothetical protein